MKMPSRKSLFRWGLSFLLIGGLVAGSIYGTWWGTLKYYRENLCPVDRSRVSIFWSPDSGFDEDKGDMYICVYLPERHAIWCMDPWEYAVRFAPKDDHAVSPSQDSQQDPDNLP